MYTIRKYQPEDVKALAQIYYNTIHLINSEHYTKEQRYAWAPEDGLKRVGWKPKFEKTQPWVALDGEAIVGFAEFEPNGHIDCFYCHHEWQGKGVGTALMNKIFEEAQEKGINCLFTEVSITAKPFFTAKGFETICEQTVNLRGQNLINYKMEKYIK